MFYIYYCLCYQNKGQCKKYIVVGLETLNSDVAEDASLQGCHTVLWVESFSAIQTIVVALI